jgi:hypothetical protein
MNHETEISIFKRTGLNIEKFVLCLIEIKSLNENKNTQKYQSCISKMENIEMGYYDHIDIDEETVVEHLSDLESAFKIYEDFKFLTEGKNISFINTLQAAEMHWHFEEAALALKHKLYISAVITYCAAIENSIKSTLMSLKMAQNVVPSLEFLRTSISTEPMLYDCLIVANKKGIPLDSLLFPGEKDMNLILKNNKIKPRIVNLRNAICHGNIYEYMQDIGNPLGKEIVFVPSMLADDARLLANISINFANDLAKFRIDKIHSV